MLPLRRMPNASRALSSLARPSHRPRRRASRLPPPTTQASTPRFSSTAAPPPPSTSAAKPAPPSSSTTTTTTPPPPEQQQQQQHDQPQPPPPRRRRKISLRPAILATLFLGAGLVTGNIVRFTIAPPPLPDVGTDMDEALSEKLRDELDRLPVVRSLAAEAGWDDARDWVEVAPWGGLSAPSPRTDLGDGKGGGKGWFGGWLWGAGGKGEEGGTVVYEGLLGDESHLVSQTLGGMKGFGPARRFVNRATRESVTVFWVGGGLTGWPGVAHGGALATAFVEALGSPEQKRTGEPASLTLTYLAPTMASNFFVLRVAPSPPPPPPDTDLPPQKDMTKRPVPSEERSADGGEEWSGTLAAVQGKVCVKAKAVLAR
ncbi:aldehyde-activating protein [Neofusicoccum parvum]|uniref:Aldehyde-activating protein n=1 Tax=Neofusicoccum parvum TaxID=310453 RepID=A0ACB5RUI9_9PEZI|nr:aldehyde-activating protein [Neofusicoccum parvum]